MKTKLIAIITAGAIASAGLSAAPAQADAATDLVKFMVGAAFIGAMVNAPNNNTQVVVTTRAHNHKPRVCLRKRWTNHGWVAFYGRKCMNRHGWHRRNGYWRHHHW
ncbi:MAG: hypothetical protein ACE5DK_04945 [Paracoccaceae bacterium]